jgi:hypothetical protein
MIFRFHCKKYSNFTKQEKNFTFWQISPSHHQKNSQKNVNQRLFCTFKTFSKISSREISDRSFSTVKTGNQKGCEKLGFVIFGVIKLQESHR